MDFAARCDPAARYDLEAALVKEREIAIVRARGRIIRLLREIARVSALLPFPVQSWLLRAPDLPSPERDRPSPLLFANAILALGAGGLAVGGRALAARGDAGALWLTWAALAAELAGGGLYRAAQELEHGPHRWLRMVWAVQIAAVFAGGVAVTAIASYAAGRLVEPQAAGTSLVLAAAFLVGLYLCEAVAARWLARAEIGADEPR